MDFTSIPVGASMPLNMEPSYGPSPVITYPGEETGMPMALMVQVIVISLTALATLIVAVRGYIRAIMIKHFGWDDVLMILALICSIALCVCICLQAQWGNVLGPAFSSVRYLQAQFASGVIYIFANVAIKISILLFCLAIFGRLSVWVRRTLLGMLLFIQAHLVAGVLAVFLSCRPIAANWTPGPRVGQCSNLLLNASINGAIGVLEDALVLCAPIYLVMQVKANEKSKRLLLGILTLGAFAFIFGTIRFVAVIVLFKHPLNPSNAVVLPIVIASEINIAIIAASLPSLSPLIRGAVNTLKTRTGTLLPSHHWSSQSRLKSVSSDSSAQFPANFIKVNRSILVESEPIEAFEESDLPPMPGRERRENPFEMTDVGGRSGLVQSRQGMANATSFYHHDP